MSIFQKSVVNRHLKNLDEDKVNYAFGKFQKFHEDKERLQNIMQLKEKNYQEGFLREIFVQTLGYTINPGKNYNLTTGFKNQKTSRKADGAILKNENAIGIIELKSTKTKDLESIKELAFGYKINQPHCKYVITSNFQSIKFYIDNTTEHEEFNLFDLPKERFKIFYFILNKDNVLNHLPERLKRDTKCHDKQITKKLYKDYKALKDRIFENLVNSNPRYNKLSLFKKSQKLLDRFLFILFAEDSGLIPPNAIRKIIEQWKQLQKLEEYKPLYNRFQLFFRHLDKGYTYKNWGKIPAYNDRLFSYDGISDNPDLKIPDGLLQNHSSILSAYDFDSEVDVNILRHIFEHSLSEIEEISAELQGKKLNKTKTKRKKDGIFYTPKYITKYIVENTVDCLCNKKKEELQIKNILVDETFRLKNRKLSQKGKSLYDTLQDYKKWLISLKILDPACGSGAFLNQTLNFLIAEHEQTDDLIAEPTGDLTRLFDTDKAILENNIFGVDINEESIEIAKLSLWLRTAKRGRPLSDLSGNIKCGNSLIYNEKIACEKAFDWYKKFPHIFNQQKKVFQKQEEVQPDYLELIEQNAKLAGEKAKEALVYSQKAYKYAEKQKLITKEPDALYSINKGDFNVVLGNPPYVRMETMKDISEFLSKIGYETYDKRGDLYRLFVEKKFNLLRSNGLISYIIPNKWLQTGYGKSLREFFLKSELRQLIDFDDIQIFKGATTYPCIFVTRKNEPKQTILVSTLTNKNVENFYSEIEKNKEIFDLSGFSVETWVISSGREQKLLENLKKKFSTLSEFVGDNSYRGVLTGLTKAFLIDNQTKKQLIREDTSAIELIKPFLQGRDVKIYSTPKVNNYFLLIKKGFPDKNIKEQVEADAWKWFSGSYTSIANWLAQFETKDRKRTDKGDYWWKLRACDCYDNFLQSKIMCQKFQVKSCFVSDDKGLYCNDSIWIIPTDNKRLLAILNSKMGWWLITKYCTRIQNGYQLIWKYFGQIPIAETGSELEEKAELMIALDKKLLAKYEKSVKLIESNPTVKNFITKLQNFYDYDFKTFVSELKKQKINLALKEQDDWEDYFDSYKQEINTLQQQINQTDKKIDKIIFELYELTAEEIKIV